MNTKYCPNCGQEKPIDAFNRNRSRTDGHGAYCRDCEKAKYGYSARREYIAANYRKHHPEKPPRSEAQKRQKMADQARKYRERNPEKHKARRAVSKAIQAKKLSPPFIFPCQERCGRQAEEYHHHHGYDREHRLDVVPVCIPCHRVLDSQ